MRQSRIYIQKNIDRLVGNTNFYQNIKIFKYSGKFCINIDDDNYKSFLQKNEKHSKKNFFISGFFQDIDLLNQNKKS